MGTKPELTQKQIREIYATVIRQFCSRDFIKKALSKLPSLCASSLKQIRRLSDNSAQIKVLGAGRLYAGTP
jgi:hypothetical protein